MIELSQIILAIKPQAVVGETKLRFITKTVPLNAANNSDDVLMWASLKNQALLKEIKHGAIICAAPPEIEVDVCIYLICENPRLSFQTALNTFFLMQREVGISKTAIIDDTATLGLNVYVGHNVVIESNCLVGENVSIKHNTVIHKNTVIGDNVKIGCNCTIGGEGFGFEKDEYGNYISIPHLGNVVIKDDVEIGNNTCVDKAILGSTVLEKNVKLDNLVHIAHGAHVGENTLIIANATICGSVTIGKNCWIAPSATILNKKTIGDNVMVGLASVVMTNVSDNTTVMGSPADILEDYKRKQFLLKKMIRK